MVYVVEDDSAVRRSMRALLHGVEAEVRTYPSGASFIDAYDPTLPGCLLLDLRLPDIDGLQVMQRLGEQWRCCPPTIVVTGYGDVPTAVALMKMGVVDFLEKPFSPDKLLSLVTATLENERVARGQRLLRERTLEAIGQLSAREREVLDELLSGKPNKQIAAELDLSAKTVSSHRANILAKLRMQSLVELARVLDSAVDAKAGDGRRD